jgi:hypothetical protein
MDKGWASPPLPLSTCDPSTQKVKPPGFLAETTYIGVFRIGEHESGLFPACNNSERGVLKKNVFTKKRHFYRKSQNL